MKNLFCFNDPATTEIYTLSLHDALPISAPRFINLTSQARIAALNGLRAAVSSRSEEHTSELQSLRHTVCRPMVVEENPVAMTNYYPSSAVGGIDAAVRFDAATFAATTPA